MSAILMEEEYWCNSQFSIVRHYGQINVNGIHYIICNKEGKDIFELSIEAKKAGRQKAIEPGEPVDLCDMRYLPVYRKLGREKFIELIKTHKELTPEKAFELAGINKPKKRKRV
jgi:hypothetical protein